MGAEGTIWVAPLNLSRKFWKVLEGSMIEIVIQINEFGGCEPFLTAISTSLSIFLSRKVWKVLEGSMIELVIQTNEIYLERLGRF
jgi:hypothetical protein